MSKVIRFPVERTKRAQELDIELAVRQFAMARAEWQAAQDWLAKAGLDEPEDTEWTY